MPSGFNNKIPNLPSGTEYDFLNGVFEWVFYNLPARADNTFIRNMYDFYKTRGGLSKKQLQALLKTIEGITVKPPFNPATLEAIIKKKGTRSKNPLPALAPLYKEDTATREKLDKILAVSPNHKAALLYMNKLNLHQVLTPADKDAISRFYTFISARQK